MADSRLKELMKEQIATISEDVQKKLEYLRSGELFKYNYYKIDIYRQKLQFGQDNDLLNAFVGGSPAVSKQNDEDSFANAFAQNCTQNTTSPQQPISNMTMQERIKRLNSKLSALRGVSMPGDYLRKH